MKQVGFKPGVRDGEELMDEQNDEAGRARVTTDEERVLRGR